MKNIILFLIMCFVVTVFAETFDMQKYKQLNKKYNETKSTKDKKELRNYICNSELSGDTESDLIQLGNIIPTQFAKNKTIPTVAQIDEKVNEKCTVLDSTGKVKYRLKVRLYHFYNYPDAIINLIKESNQIRWTKDELNAFYNSAAFCYANRNEIDKALNIYLETQNYTGALRIYIRKKDKENIWKYSKLVLQSNCSNSYWAMIALKCLFANKPSNFTNEQMAEFLKYLSDIYPTPGTDFSQWKGFMGYIGYKYKLLTGKDLFPTTK